MCKLQSLELMDKSNIKLWKAWSW